MAEKVYLDKRGWQYFVRSGIGGDRFKAFYRKPGQDGEHGYTRLSWRDSFGEAQVDLDALAEAKGWEPVSDTVATIATVSVAPAEIQEPTEGPADEGVLVAIGMRNGTRIDLRMSEYLAINLLSELERPNRHARPICACHFGNELIEVDMQEVVSVQATGIEDGVWPQPQEYSFQTPVVKEYEDTGERELYRVECKCGAEYFCAMNVGREKARCRDCQENVFADRHAEPVRTETGAKATLLTNRYWVEREPRPEQPVATTPNEGNSGSGYSDPCKIA
jgi:hypothetical protein